VRRSGRPRPLRRLWPQRVRTRLAVLYAVLFLVAGSALLALTYGLLASRLPSGGNPVKALRNAPALAICKQRPENLIPSSLLAQCDLAYALGAKIASQNQRDATLSGLLVASLIGLAITTFASAGLGWLLSGRALRPVRAITETARQAAEMQLGARIGLTGPDDELKELADTFDRMLAQIDAAFASQKRFVANAAHELRTPLTAMRTSIEVTLSKPSRTPEQLEAMAVKVRNAVERAQATIEALLTLAISERGATQHEPVDLATATEDALDATATLIARLRLRVDSALQPAALAGDRVLLERMIANLIDNAARHNTPDGWIRVRTGERDRAAFVEIANSGPSVSSEAIPLLFEPFGRAEQRLNADGGVGLGLSIASAIADAHGVTLHARSRPGGGLDIVLGVGQAEWST
jgi:signal transduction histidine kinase